jgi:HD-GYP domain-containing protein (c-di-GMP phosphodiesterase class II)
MGRFRDSEAACLIDGPVPEPLEQEAYEECMGRHIERMAMYSIKIARAFGIEDSHTLNDIFFTAILHDIGKAYIRPTVLSKPGRLTLEERHHVEAHTVIGGAIVAGMPGWDRISRAVRAHHEWWDGSGYPDEIAGEAIPFAARIVAVADVFDALTCDRPYRTPIPLSEARVHVMEESGTHFDPAVVEAFLSVPEGKWEEIRRRAETLKCPLLHLYNW